MRGGIGVRPHRGSQSADADQHHRGQQHHRGVQAEHGGDDGGDGEHLPQQAAAAGTRACHRRAGVLEKALVVAQLGQHQHRAQEGDHRRQPGNLRRRLVDRNRADRYQDRRGRHRHQGLRPTLWAGDCEAENDRKQQQRDG